MAPNELRPLTLHAYAVGANPFKVAILLELLQVPYTVTLWKFGDGPNGVKSEKFISEFNPNGRVPALFDPNTEVLSWESGACINYLLRVYDKEGKYGPMQNAREQEKVDFEKWVFWVTTGLAPMFGQMNWFGHQDGGRNVEALTRYREQSYRCFGVLEQQLLRAKSGFVLDRGFSAVDVHTYPWMCEYGYAGLSLDAYPAIRAWLARMEEMPEIKRAYQTIKDGQFSEL
ncbi:protein URE2 [Coleophoma cylindrospora]|uniref:Protein URE2 n=1 Tax=Coleophoma cylindrospora TaxID=1849047 RepID=A0A3D8R716_9HELO|nr:protein URE2 [Coleophoma cylindrospora]